MHVQSIIANIRLVNTIVLSMLINNQFRLWENAPEELFEKRGYESKITRKIFISACPIPENGILRISLRQSYDGC